MDIPADPDLSSSPFRPPRLPRSAPHRRGYLTVQKRDGIFFRYYWKVEGTGSYTLGASGFAMTKRGAIRAGTRCINRLEKDHRKAEAPKEIYRV